MGANSSALFVFMNLDELAAVLASLGCPADRSREMAAQLDRRARQLAAERHGSHEEAMEYLLGLMRQGWAAGGLNGTREA
jgi:hypothetical protein